MVRTEVKYILSMLSEKKNCNLEESYSSRFQGILEMIFPITTQSRCMHKTNPREGDEQSQN